MILYKGQLYVVFCRPLTSICSVFTTTYLDSLRPKTLFTSNKGKTDSTSGVPVVSQAGEHFITLANHAFLKNDLGVHHPMYGIDDANLIAKVVSRFSLADIALALESGLAYSSVTFDGDSEHGTMLHGFLAFEDVELMMEVYLDFP